jgi:hypothetical protein
VADAWPWATLALLGAFHGLNPAMGWLFAVAIGLQERDRGALLRALLPIALGHAAAIALVAAAVAVARLAVGPPALRLAGAAALVGFGLYRLWAGFRHRSRVGLRVGPAGLVLWSFLASTAHGAGLMIVPPLLPLTGVARPHAAHATAAMSVPASMAGALIGVAVHSLAMLAVAAGVALVVFDRVGLGVLRWAWVNVDRLWAAALIVAGAFVLVV